MTTFQFPPPVFESESGGFESFAPPADGEIIIWFVTTTPSIVRGDSRTPVACAWPKPLPDRTAFAIAAACDGEVPPPETGIKLVFSGGTLAPAFTVGVLVPEPGPLFVPAVAVATVVFGIFINCAAAACCAATAAFGINCGGGCIWCICCCWCCWCCWCCE